MLLEPTEIYVKAVRGAAALCGRGPRPCPHHLGWSRQPAPAAAEFGYQIEDPLPVPPIFALIQDRAGVGEEEMHEVFNMGCGFCCVVAASDEVTALELLRRHYREASESGASSRGLVKSAVREWESAVRWRKTATTVHDNGCE